MWAYSGRIYGDKEMKRIFLEECCEILDSMRVPITASDRRAGPYPYYGANGIQDHVADYIFDDELVLLAEDGGNFGSKTKPIAYRVSGKCWVNNHAHVLKPKVDIDVDYLCYSLMFYNTEELVNGATRQKLTQAAMRKMLIPQRTVQEQENIVSELNKVQAIIRLRQQQFQKLDELVKARFVEMFGDPLSNGKGWQKVVITEVCHAIFGGGTPSKSHPEYFAGSIPWVSPKDMKSSVINDSIDHITEEAIAHSTTNLVPTNSVLMVIRSGILKRSLPVAINNLPVTINQDMKAFVPNEAVKAAFLMHFFKAIENDVLAGVRGVTADNIDFKAFQKRAIIVPPLALQEQFADFVEQTDKSKVAVQKALDEAQLLFDSLMQKYFG